MHPLIRRPQHIVAMERRYKPKRRPNVLTRLWTWLASRGDTGAQLVEYGLLVVLIAIVVWTVVASVGTNVSSAYSDANDALTP